MIKVINDNFEGFVWWDSGIFVVFIIGEIMKRNNVFFVLNFLLILLELFCVVMELIFY